MATLSQIYQIRFTTTGVLHRVTGAVMKLADYILTTEAANAPNHANRLIWAAQAASDPETKARQLLTNVAVNGTIGAGFNPAASDEGIVDNDLDFVVGVSVDHYATGA